MLAIYTLAFMEDNENSQQPKDSAISKLDRVGKLRNKKTWPLITAIAAGFHGSFDIGTHLGISETSVRFMVKNAGSEIIRQPAPRSPMPGSPKTLYFIDPEILNIVNDVLRLKHEDGCPIAYLKRKLKTDRFLESQMLMVPKVIRLNIKHKGFLNKPNTVLNILKTIYESETRLNLSQVCQVLFPHRHRAVDKTSLILNILVDEGIISRTIKGYGVKKRMGQIYELVKNEITA